MSRKSAWSEAGEWFGGAEFSRLNGSRTESCDQREQKHRILQPAAQAENHRCDVNCRGRYSSTKVAPAYSKYIERTPGARESLMILTIRTTCQTSIHPNFTLIQGGQS